MMIKAKRKLFILLSSVIIYLVIASSVTFRIFDNANTTARENGSYSNYLVYNPGCQIVELNAFHWPAKKYMTRPVPRTCSQKSLFRLRKNNLKIDKSVLKIWTETARVNCCIQPITRIQQSPKYYNEDADWGIKYSSICLPIPITANSILINDSFIKIKCVDASKQDEISELHGAVLPPKIQSKVTSKKASYWEKRIEQRLPRPPSILVIGVDSTSRLHMIRTLPQTRKFLLANDFIEMKGYTKIGDNTFPNIMAGFAGLQPKKYKSCWADSSKKLDDCPFIWKQFNKLNYITANIEDAPGISNFHSAKLGFVLPPAEYYTMPLMVAAHLRAGYHRRHGMACCIGGETPTTFQTNFIADFVQTIGKRYPYFLFSWLTSIGHDSFTRIQTVDHIFKNLLLSVTNGRVADPDNTIILFMSDHGFRYGEFRESFLGFYEESLPFFFIRLPKSLKSRHPEWYTNLQRNSAQLTSPYDLHSTLLQIMHLATDVISPKKTSLLSKMKSSTSASPQYRQRYSFFEYIPDNRTCESAAIPPQYCMCGVSLEEESPTFYSKIAPIVVTKVNAYLKQMIDSGDCAPLVFSKFLYGRQVGKGQMRDEGSEKYLNYSDHLVAVEASPSNAHFESKIRMWDNGSTSVLGDIARINKYQGQSDCVSDFRLRPFCLCKNTKY